MPVSAAPFGVLRGRAHHLSDAGVADEGVEQRQHDGGGDEDQHALLGHHEVRDLDRLVGEGARDILRIGAEQVLRAVHDEQREPEAGEQDGEFMLPPQRPEEQPVGDDAESRDHDRGKDRRHEVVEAHQLAGVIGGQRSQHVELAVREIDDPQHAEHERQPRRDEHIAHAGDEAVDDLLGEKGEVHRGNLEPASSPLVPAKAGTQAPGAWLWIPACAGMSGELWLRSARHHEPDFTPTIFPLLTCTR